MWSQVTLWSLSGRKALWPRAAVFEPGRVFDGVLVPVLEEERPELAVDAEKAVDDTWEYGADEDEDRDDAVSVEAADETAVRDDVDDAEKAVLDGVLGGLQSAERSCDGCSPLPWLFESPPSSSSSFSSFPFPFADLLFAMPKIPPCLFPDGV